MAKMLLVNPKKRRKSRKRRTPAQRAATKRMVAANRKRRRPARKRNPVRARSSYTPVRRRPRKRNPAPRKGMMQKIIDTQLIPAATEASGALLLDIAYGYLGQFIPAQLQTGMMANMTKVVAAIGMGTLVSNFMPNRTAVALTRGAITVTLHDVMKESLAQMMPQIPLGYYSPAFIDPGANNNMGFYQDASGRLTTAETGYTQDDQMSNMGMYETPVYNNDLDMDDGL